MSIFPSIGLVEQNVNIYIPEETKIKDRGINYLFNFQSGEFVTKDGKLIEITGDAAVVFWIEKCIRTSFQNPAVYKNTGFGTNLNQYIGSTLPKSILKLRLQNDITEALKKHERIKEVNNFKLEKENDTGTISFEIELNVITEIEDIADSSEKGFIKISTLEEIQKFIGIRLMTSDRFLFKTNLGYQMYLNF